MAEFRGFESENRRLAEARTYAGTYGYHLRDLCPCNAKRAVAHLRRDHDRAINDLQRRYRER